METDLATQETTVALWRHGRYRLREQLGSGGMGVVHRAVDAHGHDVAIKLLRPHVAADEESRERFAREVRILSQVRGRHVAEVLDADVAAETPYLVTSYIPGESLEDVVSRDGPIEGPALEALAADLIDALGSLHDAEVVHRDLKPANVMMCDGEAFLIDFGIAQIADETRITVPGLVFGTPSYLAPELLSGADPSAAADIHSWAATVAFAATGRPPFGQGRFEAVSYAVVHKPADLAEVPVWLASILDRGLSKQPADRPTTQDLRSWAASVDAATETGGTTHEASQGEADSTATVMVPAAVPPSAEPAAGRDPVPDVDSTGDPDDRPYDWATDAADDWSTQTYRRIRDVDPLDDVQPVGSVDPPTAAFPTTSPPAKPVEVATDTTDDVRGDAARQYTDQHGGKQEDASASTADDEPRAPVGVDDLVAVRKRVRHPLVTTMLLVTLAALGAAMPVAATIGVLGWLVSARTAERTGTLVERRRAERGQRGTDVPTAVAALPWHLVRSVAVTALTLIPIGLAVGICIGFVALFSYASGIAIPIEPVYAGTLVLAAVFALWVFQAEAVQRGSDRILERIVGAPEFGIAAGLVLTAMSVVFLVLALVDTISFWPVAEVLADADLTPGALAETWDQRTSP